ncbi:MAG: UDP-3-O-(3-hydroxymyristoyl)glucosamine N-acyltransferase [Verrucomicrobia bacterium]|nr:UDP-3-O-(3-hydroxymyristoyl)glucosamine N-acyltransferase [Verrucomicrobiota bacterium]MBS0636803.1 UDP-3-O-(3-hydroxymyristoyl)glucosamine N-acyltransferase [Verrucomicrobiota bacterium]
MTSYSLEELAKRTGCQLVGNPKHCITGVADLESATPDDASFLTNPRYQGAMQRSHAGVVVVMEGTELPENKNFLLSRHPDATFQELIELYRTNRAPRSYFTGIHPTAVIHPTAKIGDGVTICPHVVIDGQAVIGNNSFIGAGTSIGADVTIGEECVLYQNVTIREGCTLGARVCIQPGAVIGSCGFGFTQDKQGRHSKLNQVGNCIIDDDVEIGANSTIDRARFKATRIGQGTKIDNLVQIAHGVVIGKHSLIIAQTGIAGSTQIGNHVILAGQVAVNGHIEIGDQVVVAARSGVSKSIKKPGRYAGVPVMELSEHNKNQVLLRNIDKLVEEVKQLKQELNKR